MTSRSTLVTPDAAADRGASRRTAEARAGSLFPRLLAPYLAVGVFWCFFANGWLAILAYHAQILLWSWRSLPRLRCRVDRRVLGFALPMALAGPAVYVLLPQIAHTDLTSWLTEHGLSRISLSLMVPYFGLLHPYLEQVFWAPLRERTALAHVAFSGYHLLVLSSLLPPVWLVLCFSVLVVTSYLWQRLAEQTHGLTVPILSHAFADLSIVVAAWFLT